MLSVKVRWFISVSSLLMALPIANASSLSEGLLSIINKSEQHESLMKNNDQATLKRGLTVNRDDITLEQLKTPIKLNANQQHQALVWGLTDREEIRYTLLMQNKSKVRYEHLHLSPVEVLGINARNEQERQHYALMEATLQIERAARELAWAKAYKDAVVAISQGVPRLLPFDMKKYDPYRYQPVDWKVGDKLIVFLSSTTEVKGTLSTMIDNLERNPTLKLDVIFIDNHVTRETLHTWIKTHGIPLSLLNQKRVLLNVKPGNDKQLKKYIQKQGKNQSQLPVILLMREGHLRQLSTSLF